MSFFLVLMAVIAVSFTTLGFFKRVLIEGMDKTITVTLDGTAEEFDAMLQGMKTLGEVIASNKTISYAIQYKDKNTLDKELLAYLRISGFDTITVTDAVGNVISRPHAQDRTGDNLSSKGYIAPALKGELAIVMEPGTTITLGMFYGFPIIQREAVVGAIAIGVNLGSTALVDRIKAMRQGEISVFYGSDRMATTITIDGKRADSPAEPEIADAVIKNNKTVFNNTVLSGVQYRAGYSPFVFEGKTIGIIAAAVSLEDLNGDIRSVILFIAIASLGVLFVAILCNVFFAKSISKPLARLVGVARSLEDGVLVISEDEMRYKRKDELGDLFDALALSIAAQATSVRYIKEAASEVRRSAGALSESAEESLRMSENIREATANVSAITQKISADMNDTSKNLKNLSDNSHEAAKAAEDGARVLNEVTEQTTASVSSIHDAMKEMATIVKSEIDTSEEMKSLAKSIGDITSFLTVINNIADQTNLLALNAAIEAARAGESGRGFAVVAEEVRKLAEESSQASKRIGDIIRPIREKTEVVTAGTEKSVSDLRNIIRMTNNTRAEFVKSNEDIEMANNSIQQIVAVMEEQSNSINQVSNTIETLSSDIAELNRNIETISEDMAETSQVASGVSDTSVEMSDLADSLNESLEHFVVDENES